MAEMGDTQTANDCYEMAIKADPKNSSSYFNKGVLLDRLQEHDEALEFLNKAISADSKKPNAMFYKGIVLGKNKKT